MDHSTVDESDVAVADLPATSGAHWANRDKDVLQRRTGGRPTPFRRPPAVNSFHGGADTADRESSGSWDAFAPTGGPDAAEVPDGRGGVWDAIENPGTVPADPPAFRPPRRNPADLPTGSGRASFGVTDGPISGARPEPVSPAAPRPPLADQSAAGRATVAGALPAFDPSAAGGFPAFADLRSLGVPSAADLQASGGSSPADLQAPYAPSAADLSAPDGPSTAGGAAFRAATDGTAGGHPPAAERTPASSERAPASSERAPAPIPGDVPGGIGDFLGGGRDIRPHRVGDTAGHPVEARRSRFVTAATVLLSAVVLLGGAVAGVAYLGEDDRSLTSVLELGAGSTDGKVATAPLDGRTTAGFELIAATTKVTLRTEDLGDQLYRITSAGDSGTAPSPVVSGDRVQLLLSPDGEGASGNVEVLLSTKVTWGLRFVGGTDEQVVDVTGGKISSIDIAGGSRRVDLRLSRPTGTVPVRVTGAVDELSLLSPAGSPVRVKVDSGAKTVAAGDTTLRDVRPGSTLTPKDWNAPNRYDVDAASRVTLLTVRNAP